MSGNEAGSFAHGLLLLVHVEDWQVGDGREESLLRKGQRGGVASPVKDDALLFVCFEIKRKRKIINKGT